MLAELDVRRRWIPWFALAAGFVGVLWRAILMLNDSPPMYSDEATIGLAGIHIAQGRELPIWFYGQNYMGAFESYLAAPVFAVFGPSQLTLRIPTLALYALFLFLMYRLADRLFSAPVAAATVVFLALGADRLVKNELTAAGGYPEVNTMLAALFLVGVGIAQRRYRWPVWAYFVCGLLFGLVAWIHWVAAPYLVVAFIALVVTSFAPTLKYAGYVATVLIGSAIGAWPLIWHNLTAPLEKRSLETYRILSTAGGDYPLSERFSGGFIEGMPMASGLCPVNHCTPAQLWWGPVYLLLLAIAGVMAIRMWRQHRPEAVYTLALIGGALLTIVFYVKSPSSAEAPVESARYLHYLLVTSPVWIWVIGRMLAGMWGRWGRVAAAGVTAAVLVFGLLAMVSLAQKVPTLKAWARENNQLIQALREQDTKYVYGGYWTCNLIIFMSREDILCSVIEPNLWPGMNRYPHYWSAVTQQPRQTVVVRKSSVLYVEYILEDNMEKLARRSNPPITKTEAGGFVIYELPPSVRLPS